MDNWAEKDEGEGNVREIESEKIALAEEMEITEEKEMENLKKRYYIVERVLKLKKLKQRQLPRILLTI